MGAPVRAFTLPARAKFNVRLEVGPPVDGGLHAIRSLVAGLAVCDEIAFAPSDNGFTVECDDPTIPPASNLAYRAASNLSVSLPPIRVSVSKHLPAQSGLGGGSADAAATLRGIADILAETGVTLSEDQLHAAAVRTGSDVAACLVGGFKLVEGTGDVVRPLAVAAPTWGIALLKPAESSDTAAAYRLLDAARSPSARDRFQADGQAVRALVDAIERADLSGACALMHNDFQPVIAQAFPAVSDGLARLRHAGAAGVVLCGSGSCVAGLFPTVDDAADALRRVEIRDGEWTSATGFARA